MDPKEQKSIEASKKIRGEAEEIQEAIRMGMKSLKKIRSKIAEIETLTKSLIQDEKRKISDISDFVSDNKGTLSDLERSLESLGLDMNKVTEKSLQWSKGAEKEKKKTEKIYRKLYGDDEDPF